MVTFCELCITVFFPACGWGTECVVSDDYSTGLRN